MPKYLKGLLILFLICIGGAPAWAQGLQEIKEPPPELVTDRPDQTESAQTVPIGYLQIETGPYIYLDDETGREWSYNTLLLRIGLLRRLELRVISAYEGYSLGLEGKDINEKGLAPLMLGTKLVLSEEKGALPQTALMYHISIPETGSKAFSIDKPQHELRLNVEHSLSESLGLSYNLGVKGEGAKDLEGLYTLSLGKELSDGVSAFVEVYGFLQNGQKNEHLADGGFLFLLRPNLQLDVSVGKDLSENAKDWLLSAGLSWRIPR